LPNNYASRNQDRLRLSAAAAEEAHDARTPKAQYPLNKELKV